MEPYFVSGTSVHITDGAVEVLVEVFDGYDIAERVCKLLNEAYKDAYQDGINASLREKHRDLINKITSLSIENMKLKNQKVK